MNRQTRALALGLLLAALGPCASAGAQAEPDGFTPLFNGRDLAGWTPVNTAPSTWVVRAGLLHCTGQPTGELRTDRMYQNFVLEVEWRHLVPKGNAGIFVWADDITARGQPFHRSIEVQVLENAYGNTQSHTTHGDIFPIHGAKMTPVNGRGGSRAFPTENRSKPSPEWNHYRITCRDGRITLAVNGAVVTEGRDASPRKGYICLESEGGVVDYRNLRIRELPDTPIDPADVAIADRGYRSLYSGVDLAGWTVPTEAAGAWRPRNWVLAYAGTGPGISTDEAFGDYGFLFDVRLHGKPASGRVLLRGAEAAIRFDDPRVAQAMTGGWNRVEGTLRGSALAVTVNGREVLRETLEGVPSTGPLQLAPDGKTDFANLFVRPLAQPEQEPGKD